MIVAIIAVPLILILGATFGTMLLDEGSGLLQVLTFFGTPAVALLIAVLIAFYVLGVRRGASVQELSVLTGESLRPVGMLLLVVGAGAFFGKVISATGIGDALADTMSAAGLPVIVLAYVISCGLRIAQGSATVAIVTTGGIVAPLVAEGNYSQMGVALIAMAIAAGSIILQPRERRRVLDHRQVLQHDRQADPADLDGAGDHPFGGELRGRGGPVRPLRLMG